MARRIWLELAVCIVLAGGVLWLAVFDPAQRHREFCEVTLAELESLGKKRPPGVTRQQWHHVVAWTLNAHGNMLTFKRSIPQPERDRFVTELRQRLQRPVDLRTIDRIWDEMVRLTGYEGYSDNYRPTLPERLREFEQSNATWAGVEVD